MIPNEAMYVDKWEEWFSFFYLQFTLTENDWKAYVKSSDEVKGNPCLRILKQLWKHILQI